jgi:hypothetical protein
MIRDHHENRSGADGIWDFGAWELESAIGAVVWSTLVYVPMVAFFRGFQIPEQFFIQDECTLTCLSVSYCS